ncbi:hypothetical protein [Thalassomonas actiniarum]|uniref:EAL domain-containing protein n=1 Tax=Thalassomonas actiniarum TaxID=485447 RepID=A0AAF0BYS7_9GAMM|nr:hypothetical protein [Thalassomonas actiniarum]WDD97596.1 hypothetical protein SG35_020080 [Thalassomonas actiniarum]
MPVSTGDQNGILVPEALLALLEKLKLEKVAEGLEQDFQLQPLPGIR